MKKPLPIGISDFKELIDGGFAYVDKTMLVKELVETGTKVALIPRMRRFGKTLNLSMVRYFFEKTSKDTSYLFKGLRIWKDKNLRQEQGQYPVIFLSFKDEKYTTWKEALTSLQGLIAEEFERHRYLLTSKALTPEAKGLYRKILTQTADDTLLTKSLRLLSLWLSQHHKKEAIILIDEYDTPVHTAYVEGYYKKMIKFSRNLLSNVLKDNPQLKRGMVTGILRVAKESIFSGLNNVVTFTILSESFSEQFGLLESEVISLLKASKLLHKLPDIKKWYNGYQIGGTRGIYNPWSVLSCIAKQGKLDSYWVNTSDNAIVKSVMAKGSEEVKMEVEALLKGGVTTQKISESVVFPDLERNPATLWSLLLYSGYLTLDKTPGLETLCALRIPNAEVKELYRTLVTDWFTETIQPQKYEKLLTSLTTGDIETFSRLFNDFMLSSVSLFDISHQEAEKVYHAFVLGLLVGLSETHEVKSNRESGYGRYDVMVIPKDPKQLGIVMEFKKIGKTEKTTLKTAARSAIRQIEAQKYASELTSRGVKAILYLGLAFKGKRNYICSKRVKGPKALRRARNSGN